MEMVCSGSVSQLELELDEELQDEETWGEKGRRGGEDGKEEDMEEEEEKGMGRVMSKVDKVEEMEERRKRSPACLIRCLKSRRLHPAQCHALC